MIIVLILSLFLALVITYRLYRLYKYNFLVRIDTKNEMSLHQNDIDFNSDVPRFYYADLTKCILNKKHCFTQEGLFRIGGNTVETSEINVCGVCEYAMIMLEEYYALGTDKSLAAFYANLQWIMDNAEEDNGMIFWYYNYDMGTHKGKWASAISQGLAISVLVRAYVLDKDERFLKLAEKAFLTIEKPIHEGGFKYVYDSFSCWFEESNMNTHILNGHVFAMLGIYDLYRVTQNVEYLKLFKMACANIKTNINKFDLGFASTYDAVSHNIANNSYNKINLNLLKILARINNDDFFMNTANKWDLIYISKSKKILGFIYTLSLTISFKIRNYGQ